MTSSGANDIWQPAEYAAYHKMVFRAMFDFLNAHFPPQDNPDWWIKLSEDLSMASYNAKGGTLVDGMLSAIADYLEEECRKRKEADF